MARSAFSPRLKRERTKLLTMMRLPGLNKLINILRIILLILFPLAALWLFLLQCRSDEQSLKPLKGVRYAHRGLHHEGVPENSLPAFREAVAHGYGAELDIHLTKDGRLAVVHDSDLSRLTGKAVKVEELTAAELKSYPLLGTSCTVPLLEEVLPIFAGKTPLIIELKCEGRDHEALCQAATALLDRYPDLVYCLESFDPMAIMWLRQHRPEIVRGQLSSDQTKKKDMNGLRRFLLTHLYTNILTCPDFIAYRFADRGKVPELKLCRRLYQVQEVSWTIRSEEEARSAEALGNLVIFEGFGR